MRSKYCLTKKDVFIAFGCVVILLANLGTVGSGGRRRAKEAVCLSNLKRWGVVLLTFANDNGGYFTDRSDAVWWPETLWSYYKNRRLLLCPDATRTREASASNPFMAWLDWMDIDGDNQEEYVVGSYVINYWISKDPSTGFWRTPHVQDAQHVPILSDGQWKDMQPYPWDEPPECESCLWTPGAQEIRRTCVNRHNGGVNAVFMDGSVRKVGLKFLWILDWHRDWPIPESVPLPVWPAWMENFRNPD
jgi:prepilin-type processing-associated H-X9-DG protein